MGVILDLIILAIFIASVAMGYRKGLVKVAVQMCAVIIALVVSLTFYKPVSNMIIEKTEIDENIQNAIIENGTSQKEESEEKQKDSFMIYIEKYVEDSVTDAKNNAVESVAEVVSEKLINIVVIVLLFIVTRLALILLTLISDVITSLPIIKQFNKAGGLIYGILRGVIYVYLALAALFLIVSLSANQVIVDLINTSLITKVLYANNILLNLIF